VNYKDQGWGNQKGKVKVALMRGDTEIAGEILFSELASHSFEQKNRILRDEAVV
jgi:hypothetical protein